MFLRRTEGDCDYCCRLSRTYIFIGFFVFAFCQESKSAPVLDEDNVSRSAFGSETLGSIQALPDPKFDCRDRPDGSYPDFQRACRIFYVCRSGFLHVFWCQNGTVFSPETGYCTSPARTRCLSPDRSSGWLPLQVTDECTQLQDGVYPDYNSGCQGFYFCTGGIKQSFSCPGKTLFDWQTGFCRPSSLVACDPLSCEGRSPGFYADPQSGCQRYAICAEGRKTEYVCPSGTIFNQELLRCTDPQTTSCRPQQDDEIFNCYGLPDGYYVDYATGCRSFHYCHANRAKQFTCPSSLVFSKRLLTCDHPWKSQCEKSPTLCAGKSNGVHPKFETDCKEFVVCRNGKVYQSGACVQGKLLNPVTGLCQPKGLITCAPVKDPDCGSRPDGMYPDLGTGCSAFYVCLSGRRILTSYCTGKNYLFDVATGTCLPAPLVWCNASNFESVETEYRPMDEYDCKSRVGIFPDFKSGCSGYIVCAHGRTERRRCVDGLFYDPATSMCTVNNGDRTCPAPAQLASFRCLPGDDGIFLDHTSGCKRWHECFAEQGKTFECPEDQIFSSLFGMCMNGEDISCVKMETVLSKSSLQVMSVTIPQPPNCATKKNGIYRDPVRCAVFHICVQTEVYSYECPSGYAFHSKAKRCAHLKDVSCFQEALPDLSDAETFSCEDRTDGMYPNYTCQKYWICEGGRTTTAYCPQGELFNVQSMVCEPSAKVSCLHRQSVVTVATSTVVPSPSSVADDSPNSLTSSLQCPNGATGFYPDYDSGCKRFRICFRAIQRSYSCPSVLLFNPDTKNCDLPENVDCRKPELLTDRGNFNCTGKPNGYYADFSSDCRQYFACTDHGVLLYSCPSGRLFNQRTLSCDNGSSVACHDAPDLDMEKSNTTVTVTHAHGVPKSFIFQCLNKADGFYPDFERHCHVFYRCIRGKKFSHYCKPGLLFNPKVGICDFEENVVCSPPERNQ